MRKSIVLSIAFICLAALSSNAQDTLSNGKALNIPFKKYGLSFGNSYEFNGIRINFADKNVRRINGLNVTFWIYKTQKFEEWLNEANYNSVINGISIGTMPVAGSMQPINLGILGSLTSSDMNGLSVGGIALASGRSINGLSVSGLLTQCDVISGFAISGLFVGGTGGINGVAIAGLAVSSDRSDINGFAFSPGVVFCGNNYRGVGISGIFLKSNSFKGLAVSAFSRTEQMFGLSIALYNRTNELHGIQAGLLNYAGNNSKGFRLLPLINMHLRKK